MNTPSFGLFGITLTLAIGMAACASPSEDAANAASAEVLSPNSMAVAPANAYRAALDACYGDSKLTLVEKGACFATATDAAAETLQPSIAAADALIWRTSMPTLKEKIEAFRIAYAKAFCGTLAGEAAKTCAAGAEVAMAKDSDFLVEGDLPTSKEVILALKDARSRANIDKSRLCSLSPRECAFGDVAAIGSALGIPVADIDGLEFATTRYCERLTNTRVDAKNVVGFKARDEALDVGGLCAFSTAAHFANLLLLRQPAAK
jgi:hypothetical protein